MEELFSGLAIGGPMNGREVESRFPGGVLFVDKPANKCWLYDFYSESGRFYVRPQGYDAFWDELDADQKMQIFQDTVGIGLDSSRELDYESRMRAAESSNTEVRAIPGELDEVEK